MRFSDIGVNFFQICNATAGQAAFQVGFLAEIFSLVQFIFAPLWGRWSDRTGRRLLFLDGLFGVVFSMVFFALAMFEGTFAFHAKILLDFGPFEMR